MAEPAEGLHFDRVATTYHRGRPPYPAQLYDRLDAHGLFRPGAHLLEIGAGTGQATAALVARGATVDAVEPGPALAEALRRLDRVRVIEARAEEAVLADATYDGIVAATCLHWVDVPAVLPAWHRALRPGGLLAVWWAVFGDPSVRTPFRDRLDRIARDTGRHRPDDDLPRPLRTDDRVAELGDGGLFEVEEAVVLPWPLAMTPAALRDLFTTFPTWGEDPTALDLVADAARASVGRDGTVEEHYLCALYVARRRPVVN